MIACSHCGGEFEPRRSTARYCGDGCRKRASRRNVPPGGRGAAPDAFLSVTGVSMTPEGGKPFCESRVTLTAPGIVADEKYPGMYRVRLPDGTLSDMVNLTRARDAARALAERERRAANRPRAA